MKDKVDDKNANPKRNGSSFAPKCSDKSVTNSSELAKEEFRILGCKHVLNAQFSIYSKCCDKWFVCR